MGRPPGQDSWTAAQGGHEAVVLQEAAADSVMSPEPPHPRFHPVPVWDPFHPPADLMAEEAMMDEPEACQPPFYIRPMASQTQKPVSQPMSLPYPRN